eukprot:scaffold28332_cov31-Tisochrysis_lutea.AAC.5
MDEAVNREKFSSDQSMIPMDSAKEVRYNDAPCLAKSTTTRRVMKPETCLAASRIALMGRWYNGLMKRWKTPPRAEDTPRDWRSGFVSSEERSLCVIELLLRRCESRRPASTGCGKASVNLPTKVELAHATRSSRVVVAA